MASGIVSKLAVFVVLFLEIHALPAKHRSVQKQPTQIMRDKYIGFLPNLRIQTANKKGYEEIAYAIDNMKEADTPVLDLINSQLQDAVSEVTALALDKLVSEECRESVLTELFLGSLEYNLELEFDASDPESLYNVVERWATMLMNDDHYTGSPQELAVDYVRFVYGPVLDRIEEISGNLGALNGEERFFDGFTNSIRDLSNDLEARPITLRKVLLLYLKNFDLLVVSEQDCSGKLSDEVRNMVVDLLDLDDNFVNEDFKEIADLTDKQMNSLDEFIDSSYQKPEVFYVLFSMASFGNRFSNYIQAFAEHLVGTYLGRKLREQLVEVNRNSHASDIEQIIVLLEELSVNMSSSVAEVSEEDKMLVFQFAFRSAIEELSSSCPGAGLADLITGYLRYSIYDLYGNEEVENALNKFYNEAEAGTLQNRKSLRHRTSIKRHTRGFPTTSMSPKNVDPQEIRSLFVENLSEISEILGFSNSDQIFWLLDSYLYEVDPSDISLREFMERLLKEMLESDHFSDLEMCNQDPAEVSSNLARQLNKASASLNQIPADDLYGVSPDELAKMSSSKRRLILNFLVRLHHFRTAFAQRMNDFASLLITGRTSIIDDVLASEMSSNSIHLIKLYWSGLDDENDDVHYEYSNTYDYSTETDHVEEVLAQHGEKLYGLFSDYIRQMLVTLFQKFAEEAQNQGVNTDRFLDILSNALDNLDVNTRY